MSDKKIIDYMIFSFLHCEIDEWNIKNIKHLIREGWQPLGGLCAANTVNNNNSLYQVMVKYEDDENSEKDNHHEITADYILSQLDERIEQLLLASRDNPLSVELHERAAELQNFKHRILIETNKSYRESHIAMAQNAMKKQRGGDNADI
jgi:hypothetical protein